MDADNLGDSERNDGERVAMEPTEVRDEPAGVDEPLDPARMESSVGREELHAGEIASMLVSQGQRQRKRPALGISKGVKKAPLPHEAPKEAAPSGETTPRGSNDMVEVQPPTSRPSSMDSQEGEGVTRRSQSKMPPDLPLYSESLSRREEIPVPRSK
ncbi:hypothetical protein NE237_022691 [Protea cynaroides]|uniref:Uncharacterized protein n=1 Tax=Protea cynaroides TaxID=273540 RepID=A0A9Q0HAC8_9MAGN|nr:hypothetical protein NE237_022691 [Protea cynaroides]